MSQERPKSIQREREQEGDGNTEWPDPGVGVFAAMELSQIAFRLDVV